MSTEAPSQQAPRAAPLALWRAMGAFLNLLFDLLGGPDKIAAKIVLTKDPRALMLKWLRAGEIMLRRLLLIEASALAAQRPAPSATRAPRKRIRRAVEFLPETPEDWRVSFRCPLTPQRARHRRRRTETKARDTRFHSAWPIAERFEALLRVYNDPFAAARRLARRLAPSPYRARAILYVPVYLTPLIGAELCSQLSAAASDAYLLLNTS